MELRKQSEQDLPSAMVAFLLQQPLFNKLKTSAEIRHQTLYGGKESHIWRIFLNRMETVVCKQTANTWQRREADVYSRYIDSSLLQTPELIAISSNKEYLLLEDLRDYRPKTRLNQQELVELKQWLIKKHKYFANCKGLLEKPNLVKHVGWLIQEPIQILKQNSKHIDIPEIRNLVAKEFVLLEFIAEMDSNGLPIVLDHCDLESQNLLYNQAGKLKVIDWANAIRSYGLFDIAQLIKNHVVFGYTDMTSELISEISDTLQISDLLYYIKMFGSIKELTLLSYYEQNSTLNKQNIANSLIFLNWIQSLS